jgi:hypothetical protein
VLHLQIDPVDDFRLVERLEDIAKGNLGHPYFSEEGKLPWVGGRYIANIIPPDFDC